MWLALLAACGPTIETLSESRSAFGYYEVGFDLSGAGVAPEEVEALSLGGVDTYGLRAEGDLLYATVQGMAGGGPADAALEVGGEALCFEAAFTFDAPPEALSPAVAIGASLTSGVQSAVPSGRGTLAGAGAQIARALGLYLPQPVLVDGLMAELGPADFGPPPGCEAPDFYSHLAAEVLTSLAALEGSDGETDYTLGRLNPATAPYNLAVPASNVGEVLRGVEEDDFGEQYITHLLLEPSAALDEPVTTSQLERLEALAPRLIVAPDLLANDVIDAVTGSSLDPEAVHPLEEVRPALEELVQRLAATGAWVFLSNAPKATVLPAAQDLARAMLAEDPDAEEAIAALLGEIDRETGELNQALEEIAAGYDNVVVVDLYARIEEIERGGVVVGGEQLTIEKFGGLLSLDGLHFSDTGYALMAQLTLDAIAAATGVGAAPIDLEAVMAADPFSPAALRAAGLERDACEQRW